MEKLWIMAKVDGSSGEVVMYDSSLQNEFLKSEKDYEKFFEIFWNYCCCNSSVIIFVLFVYYPECN